MAQKQEKVLVVTAAGEAVWPKLHDPDTKFNADGELGTKLAYDPQNPKAAAFLAQIEELVDAAFQKAKDENPKFQKVMKRISPIKPELDENGDETGRVLINFKRIVSVKSKKTGKTYTFRVMLYDAKGNPLPPAIRIGGGSILKASFEPWPYFNGKEKEAGISLRLEAVQVLKLVEYRGGSNAAGFGFAEEEEGFDATGMGFPDATDEFEETPSAPSAAPNADF